MKPLKHGGMEPVESSGKIHRKGRKGREGIYGFPFPFSERFIGD
jgi:hypothetical protein